MSVVVNFIKNGPSSASFSFIFGLFKQKIYILQQIIVKNSIQYPALGFKHTTFWLWDYSFNHQTRAPALVVYFYAGNFFTELEPFA